MSPSLASHLAAVNSGAITKSNLIGIRKQISAMEKGERWGGSWRDRMPDVDDVFAVEQALSDREPIVSADIRDAGLKQLSDRRYRKRFTDAERAVIDHLHIFRLVGFQRAGRGRMTIVPVFRAYSAKAGSFLFVNVPWQSAFVDNSLTGGPSVVHEGDF